MADLSLYFPHEESTTYSSGTCFFKVTLAHSRTGIHYKTERGAMALVWTLSCVVFVDCYYDSSFCCGHHAFSELSDWCALCHVVTCSQIS